MKRKLISVILAISVFVGLMVVPMAGVGAASSNAPQVQTLYTTKSNAVGEVYVSNNGTKLVVKFLRLDNWEFLETDLFIDTSAAGKPQTADGSPIHDQCISRTDHDGVSEYTYSISIPDEWRYPYTDLKICAYAVVRQNGDSKTVETARTFGTQYSGQNRSSHFTYLRDLSVCEARALIRENPNLMIIDVRNSPSATIPGAINIRYNSADTAPFANSISQFDRHEMYLLYCNSGPTSGAAATFMRKNGFTSVYNLAGGYNAWNAITICPVQ